MIEFPWKANDIPHCVLEVNSNCNISCRSCYHEKNLWTKPIGAVLCELELIASKQNTHTVTLAGGEPTLHPELPLIVAEVKKRGFRVSLTSNGLALTETVLRELKDAGLDVVMLHVDEGQTRPDLLPNPSFDELNALRWKLAKRVRSVSLAAGLCVTLYPDTLGRVNRLVELVLNSEEFGFLFFTHAVELRDLLGKGSGQAVTSNADVCAMLEKHELEPFAVLPSEQGNRPSIMSYYVPVRHQKRKTQRWLTRSGRIDSLLVNIARLAAGRHLYFSNPNSLTHAFQVLGDGVGSGRFFQALKFIFAGGRLTGKRLLFEEAPRRNAEGKLVCCKHCPNQTVRNGQIVPVCQAGLPEDGCA